MSLSSLSSVLSQSGHSIFRGLHLRCEAFFEKPQATFPAWPLDNLLTLVPAIFIRNDRVKEGPADQRNCNHLLILVTPLSSDGSVLFEDSYLMEPLPLVGSDVIWHICEQLDCRMKDDRVRIHSVPISLEPASLSMYREKLLAQIISMPGRPLNNASRSDLFEYLVGMNETQWSSMRAFCPS